MIPGPLFSWPLLILMLLPVLAALLSAGLLLHALAWWWRQRAVPAGQRARFWSWPVVLFAVLAMAGNLWGLYLLHRTQQWEAQHQLRTHYQESRRHFVLPHDFQYGELLIPQGSLIDRYDAFDNGEPQRPLRLGRLDAVRFAHPVQVAGAWATAMDGHTLELDRDQRIGPVFHFDAQTNDGYGDWVRDPSRATIACRKGQHARFHVPSIDYDIAAEFGKPEPDGPNARFRPSQWGVVECSNRAEPIAVPPPYAGPAPEGAQAQVWGPLLPAVDDD